MTAIWPRPQYRVGIDCKYLFPWMQILPLRVGEVLAYYASTNSGMRRVKGLKPLQPRQTAAPVRRLSFDLKTPATKQHPRFHEAL